MDFRTKKSLAVPERAEEEKAGFDIGALSANLEAKDVSLGGITFDEVKLSAGGLVIGGGSVRAKELQGVFILSESSLNRLASSRASDSVRDIEIAIYVGKLRVSGR